MRAILLLLVLVATTAFAGEGTVVIKFSQLDQLACTLPDPPPPVRDEKTGTYSRPYTNTMYLVACIKRSEWAEEWTDLPEKGGKFIRRVGPLSY